MALASTAVICKEQSNQINHTQRMQLNSLDSRMPLTTWPYQWSPTGSPLNRKCSVKQFDSTEIFQS